MEMKRPVSIEDGSEVIAGNDWLKILVDFDGFYTCLRHLTYCCQIAWYVECVVYDARISAITCCLRYLSNYKT